MTLSLQQVHKNTYCAAHTGALLIFSTGPSDKTLYELVIKTHSDKYNSCSDLVRDLNHFPTLKPSHGAHALPESD